MDFLRDITRSRKISKLQAAIVAWPEFTGIFLPVKLVLTYAHRLLLIRGPPSLVYTAFATMGVRIEVRRTMMI